MDIVAEATRDALASALLYSPPPAPPRPPRPPGPALIAGVNEAQPDALVFLGLALSCAIPFGMLVRAVEEGRAACEYSRVPLWLFAAYACNAAAYALLFFGAGHPLDHAHWALTAATATAALRHSHRAGDSPRHYAGAVSLSFLVAFSVVYAFKRSLRPRRCASTLAVLVVFCAAPAWRLHLKQRRGEAPEPRERAARRRGGYATLVLLVLLSVQPSLGVCGPPAPWAESSQMLLELGALALVTDSLW